MKKTRKEIEEIAKKQQLSTREVVWQVINELRKELEINLSDEAQYAVSGEASTHKDQRRAIQFLINLSAIEVKDRAYSNSGLVDFVTKTRVMLGQIRPLAVRYILKVNRDELNKIYYAYRDIASGNAENNMKFYSENGMLLVQGKQITFKRETPPFYILDMLFSNKDEYYAFGEMMAFGTINELITADGGVDELSSKALYNAKDFINRKVFKEAGLKDYLVVKNKFIQVNNDYIKK